MKTPFDTPRRIEQRRIDDIRIAISVAVEQREALGARGRAIDQAVAAERAIPADPRLPTCGAWFRRMTADREKVEDATRLADAQLAQLRHQAGEAYGAMRAMEKAADRFIAEATRAIDAAEQSAIDDIGAARLAAERRARRRKRQ